MNPFFQRTRGTSRLKTQDPDIYWDHAFTIGIPSAPASKLERFFGSADPQEKWKENSVSALATQAGGRKNDKSIASGDPNNFRPLGHKKGRSIPQFDDVL